MKNKFCGFISILMLLSLALPVSAGAVSVTGFEDVKPSDWYYEAVEYVAANGLFNGTSITTFSPDTTMTRGMFVTVLGRLHDIPDSYSRTQSTPFNDVTQADYFFPYTVWASDNGIVNGIGNKLFDPHGEFTREQAATILYRYAEKYGYGTELSDEGSAVFPDMEKTSGYAVGAVSWAISHEILIGVNGGLAPTDNASRAQVAYAFMKFSILNDASTPEDGSSEAPVDWENYNPTYEIPTGKSTVDANGGYYDYDLANELMAQVNALRESNGLDVLLYHPQIQEWAGIRAQEHIIIHDYPNTAHIRPDGTDCLTVGVGLCFENLLWSENYNTRILNIETYSSELVTAWYNSESHRHSMLSSAANLGAISCYVKGNNVYIAHLFSMRTLYYMDYLI